MMKTRLILPLFLFLTLIFSACDPTVEESASTASALATVVPTIAAHPSAAAPPTDGGIDFISNGDIRFLPIQTDLASATPIDIPLQGKPAWVAGIPHKDGVIWAVAFADGSLQAFSVDSSDYAQVAISPESLPPGTPLTIYSQGGQLLALTAPPDASPLARPILLDENKLAYIATNGDLVITQNGAETRLPVNALPDSALVYNRSRLLLLTNPTDSYTHGVLGDEVEAAGITLVQTHPEVNILNTILIPAPDVIEGIYPIWADMNIDGELEIILTLSNAQGGARIVAFHEDPSTGSGQASLLAEGPAIGTGFRWRHQLMVAPFGAAGKTLLAVVRTPHIGGVVEFYRLNGKKLEIVKEIPGISTHSIGSRNLFTAQAGDFDNDGQVELLAPDQSHTRLGIVDIDGNPITWLDLGAELTTNLAAIAFDENTQVAIAAGLSNNSLRIWLP